MYTIYMFKHDDDDDNITKTIANMKIRSIEVNAVRIEEEDLINF